MAGRKDDIFKKLNKETPLVKSMNGGATPGEVDESMMPKAYHPKKTAAGPAQPITPAKAHLAGKANVKGAPAKKSGGVAKYEFAPSERKAVKKFRHELKFFINERDYRELRAYCAAALRNDPHAPEGGYAVRSLYFDDRENSALWDKLSGFKEREKYRIRVYNYSDERITLERKVKRGEYVAKDTMLMRREEVEALVAGDCAFLMEIDEPLSREFYAQVKNNGMRPVAVVDYYREPYIYPVEDVRVTFDIDLRSGVFSRDLFDPGIVMLPIYEKGLHVMEIKFNRFLPQFVRGFLNNSGSAVRSAISKYTMCRMYD